MAITKTAGAMENALQPVGLPAERSTCRVRPPSEGVHRQPADHAVHERLLRRVPRAGGGILLVWLFFRHRDRYAAVRDTFALTIAGCITIQALVPMAPPRFLPELGFVDAGLKYHLSVYGRGGSGVSNELGRDAVAACRRGPCWSASPSSASAPAGGAGWCSLHPVLTMLSITLTANHWWLDGVVAVMVMGVAYAIQWAVTMGYHALRARAAPRPPDDPAGKPPPDDDAVVDRPLTNVS